MELYSRMVAPLVGSKLDLRDGTWGALYSAELCPRSLMS